MRSDLPPPHTCHLILCVEPTVRLSMLLLPSDPVCGTSCAIYVIILLTMIALSESSKLHALVGNGGVTTYLCTALTSLFSKPLLLSNQATGYLVFTIIILCGSLITYRDPVQGCSERNADSSLLSCICLTVIPLRSLDRLSLLPWITGRRLRSGSSNCSLTFAVSYAACTVEFREASSRRRLELFADVR